MRFSFFRKTCLLTAFTWVSFSWANIFKVEEPALSRRKLADGVLLQQMVKLIRQKGTKKEIRSSASGICVTPGKGSAPAGSIECGQSKTSPYGSSATTYTTNY